jgi:TPR repeat protein
MEEGRATTRFSDGLAAFKKKDYATAARIWQPLAERGSASAQYNLGLLYSHGAGVARNDIKAAEWFRSAAEQGHARSQLELGLLYAEGKGVPQRKNVAIGWFRRAAEQGEAGAQLQLALAYVLGEGVKKNSVRGYMWLSLMIEQGTEDQKRLFQKLKASMTAGEIAEAERLADAWIAEHRN